jgi:hypothetical protein
LFRPLALFVVVLPFSKPANQEVLEVFSRKEVSRPPAIRWSREKAAVHARQQSNPMSGLGFLHGRRPGLGGL